jgi:hypothetical protein
MSEDYPDHTEAVSREPITVNPYSDFLSRGVVASLAAGATYIYKYDIPNDGYQYTLVNYHWTNYGYGPTWARTTIFRCLGGILLDQATTNYIWNCAKWVKDTYVAIPSVQGALSMSYPGAYVMSATNFSSVTKGLFIFMAMYRKLKDV